MNNAKMPFVKLRAMEPEDLDELYLMENDTEVWNVGVTNVPYSRFTLHEYIASASGDIYADRQVRLMVVDYEENVVGMVDLVNFDPRHCRAEVGIVIKKGARRQGYAHAVLQRLHTYALDTLHLHQLYAVVDMANGQALSLFSDMGYAKTATLNDWLYDGTSYSEATIMQLLLKKNT
jgi:diamine N-acetyltransferase